MNPDGLSYLDLATNFLQGGPSKLISGYWSPGYPALLSLVLFFHPSPSLEFPLTHLVNFLVFLATLWIYSTFLHNWLSAIHGRRYITPFAFCTFLWFTLRFIGVDGVNPDLCIAAITFLIAGITCRLYLPTATWKTYIALGVALGVGYYFKAAMLPLGFAFLALVFLLPPFSGGLSRPKLLLSALVFLLLTAPLIVALSVRANKLTFGETGRLNYAWFVNGSYWSGGLEPPEPNSIIDHPAPKLMTKPLTLEFASPVSVTYPLWYDPSYWYSGTRTRVDLRQQIKALAMTLKAYKEMIFDSASFVAGAIVLWVFGLGNPEPAERRRILWWQVAWPLAAFAMYALVTVESRYVGAFYVLFWLALYGALITRVDRTVTLAVFATVLATAMIPFTAHLAMIGGGFAKGLIHRNPPDYQTEGQGLIGMGLQSGDRLAVVGYAHNCYYARYAHLRVVAQIPDSHEFWQLSALELKSLEERLASIGVKAVVASNRPETSAPADWKDVKLSDSNRFSILVLPPSP